MYCTANSSCSLLAIYPNSWSQFYSMKYSLLLASFVFINFIITPLPIVADDNTNLKILVPLKQGFPKYLQWQSLEIPITPNSSVSFSGFAIDVFQACIDKLSYKVNYTLIPYGDGITNPSYQGLVDNIASKVLLMINFHLNFQMINFQIITNYSWIECYKSMIYLIFYATYN